MTVLSSLLAIGLGFAATAASQAAPLGSGVSEAAKASSMIQDVQYRRHCRSVRVCHRGPFGHRRCEVTRVCR
jgi:hypothetical protein